MFHMYIFICVALSASVHCKTFTYYQMHTLRMTGLRLVNSAGLGARLGTPLRLLPTELVVVVLEPETQGELINR